MKETINNFFFLWEECCILEGSLQLWQGFVPTCNPGSKRHCEALHSSWLSSTPPKPARNSHKPVSSWRIERWLERTGRIPSRHYWTKVFFDVIVFAGAGWKNLTNENQCQNTCKQGNEFFQCDGVFSLQFIPPWSLIIVSIILVVDALRIVFVCATAILCMACAHECAGPLVDNREPEGPATHIVKSSPYPLQDWASKMKWVEPSRTLCIKSKRFEGCQPIQESPEAWHPVSLASTLVEA